MRYNNWYDVLKSIYFHHSKGKEIPISRVQWLTKYPEFETYNPVIEDNFTNHCEIGLITYLLQQGKPMQSMYQNQVAHDVISRSHI